MNWEAVVAVTEVIGVIALIASLVYVGIQIKQNANLARAGIVHNTSVAWANASAMLATDAELTDIYLRGVSGEALSPVDTKRLESLIDVYMTNLEDIDHQYQSDLYFDEDRYQRRGRLSRAIIQGPDEVARRSTMVGHSCADWTHAELLREDE